MWISFSTDNSEILHHGIISTGIYLPVFRATVACCNNYFDLLWELSLYSTDVYLLHVTISDVIYILPGRCFILRKKQYSRRQTIQSVRR